MKIQPIFKLMCNSFKILVKQSKDLYLLVFPRPVLISYSGITSSDSKITPSE